MCASSPCERAPLRERLSEARVDVRVAARAEPRELPLGPRERVLEGRARATGSSRSVVAITKETQLYDARPPRSHSSSAPQSTQRTMRNMDRTTMNRTMDNNETEP